MTEGAMGGNLDRLLRLADPADDHDLLGRLPGGGGDAALAELVRRHGPAVLGVCRRVLRHEQDAEDAFQATFLVLARKAGSVRRAESLGAWLFGVARHVALRLRDKGYRRRRHELAAGRPEAAEPDADRGEWLAVLDEEVGRLPGKYRSAMVACHLEGRTQEDAARELGLSLSTLRRRLDRGRELLRARLTGRGLTLPAALTGMTAVVPPALAAATVRAATDYLNGGRASPPAILAEGVITMMARAKLTKAAAGVLLALGGVLAVWQTAPGAGQNPPTPAAARPDDPKPKTPLADPTPKSFDPRGPGAGQPGDRIRPGDRLAIKATNTFVDHPLDGVLVVEAGGTVALGPMYGGRVKVDGLTLEAAEAVVLGHLKQFLRSPGVQLTRAAPEDADRVGKLERRVQQLEQEVLELRGVIRDLQKGRGGR